MSPLFKALQQLEQDLLRRPVTPQEVLPGAQPMQTLVETEQEAADSWAAVEADGCVSCGAPVVPGTAGCKDCNEYAIDSVGAPRCLTEKQVFVMSYTAERVHHVFRREGHATIDSDRLAAVYREAEMLWGMLQKGLEKG